LNNDVIVSLNSVIVHQGIPTDGHYYSYAKINQHFYKFNDSQVNQVSKSEIFLHQSGGRHPYKGITKDHSAYLLTYSVKNDLKDESIYTIAQNQNSSEINRDYLLSLYQKRADLFPKTLLDHFSSLSYKLTCTDVYKLNGYDGPGAFNFSRRFPITKVVQMSMDELRAVGIHKKYHYIFSILSNSNSLPDMMTLENSDKNQIKENPNSLPD
ncbi:Ubiquitin carboxyl-terminal hydrolase 15, partial [Pseudoloma neurophilia]